MRPYSESRLSKEIWAAFWRNYKNMVERSITRAPLGFPSTRTSVGLLGVGNNSPTTSIKRQFYPVINPTGHFYGSLMNQERVPLDALRRFSRTVPAQRAITRIVDGVLAMEWYVRPPKDKRDDVEAQETAEFIEKAIRKPNREEHNNYDSLVCALVTELITIGVACVERQPGTDETQAFWVWDANAANIHINPAWTPQNTGIVPRYYDMTPTPGGFAGIPIMDEHLFTVIRRSNSYEYIPPSCLETAYAMINAWLGLSVYQDKTTSHATQEYILDLGDVSEDQLIAFREYWETEVQGQGRMPIVAGKGLMKTDKIGASDDAGLYQEYTQYLLKVIAFCFGLSQREFNITDHDNRATSGAAADSSFQDAILPMAKLIIGSFENELVDFYYPGYIMKLTDTEPRTEKEEAESAVELFKNNIITQNEARQRIGDETVPEGDKFFDGSKPDEPSDEMAMKQKLDQQTLQHGELTLKERQMNLRNQASGNLGGANGGAGGGSKPGKSTGTGIGANKLRPFQLSRRPDKKRDYQAELEAINLNELLSVAGASIGE